MPCVWALWNHMGGRKMATLEQLMKDLNVARKKHIDAILFGTREDIDDCWATIQAIERRIAERSE